LLTASFAEIQPLLIKALQSEKAKKNDDLNEIGVAAQGMAHAGRILGSQFTLIVTNVPYLGNGKQDDTLGDFCEQYHADAKADLATVFVERCLAFSTIGGTTSLVTLQAWLFLGPYKKLRLRLLRRIQWNLLAKLGTRAFETITGEVVNVALSVLTQCEPTQTHLLGGIDVESQPTIDAKQQALRSGVCLLISQANQLNNPDGRLALQHGGTGKLLQEIASSFKGVATGDLGRFIRFVWEVEVVRRGWELFQGAVSSTMPYGGREQILLWENGKGTLYEFVASKLGYSGVGAWLRGGDAWG
jgi:hypothetical protein